MLVTSRKSKYKTKVEFPAELDGKWNWNNASRSARSDEMRKWCEDRYGAGGRKNRWRFGWTTKTATFYFREGKDATMFVLRWCNDK